jgi:hypothetical protein
MSTPSSHLQNHEQGVLQLLRGNFLAVHLERASAAAAQTAQIVKRERADAEAVVLEVELDNVFAGSERCPGPPT